MEKMTRAESKKKKGWKASKEPVDWWGKKYLTGIKSGVFNLS